MPACIVSRTGMEESDSDALPVPPPVRYSQRPLRRRIRAPWACVECLEERNERGPYETAVRCFLCGLEFEANTERVESHFRVDDQDETSDFEPRTTSMPLCQLTAQLADQIEVDPDSSNAEFDSMDMISETSGNNVAPPQQVGGKGSTMRQEMVLPVARCLGGEHAILLRTIQRWFEVQERLDFFERTGLPVTPELAAIRRKAKESTAMCIAYPSIERIQVAARAAAAALEYATTVAQTLWQPKDSKPVDLRWAGRGLLDRDCRVFVGLLKEVSEKHGHPNPCDDEIAYGPFETPA